MTKKAQYILTYDTQVIFETVVDEKQGVCIIEGGESRFMEGTLKQLTAYNELYYATNLAIAKNLAKDVLGSVHAAPYIFLDMVWVPLEVYNRTVVIYAALHHIERISAMSAQETILELRDGTRIRLDVSKGSVYKRLFVACILKILMDGRKQQVFKAMTQIRKRREILKEEGSVYYIEKDDGTE